MQPELDVLIIGGGLAGLTTALHLQKSGRMVTLIEKNDFPCHKVCGEYVSNEVLPYLDWLDLTIDSLSPNQITQLQLTTLSGKSIMTGLSLGGFGISRYEFDYFLYQQLIKRGVNLVKDTVTTIEFANDEFTVSLLLGNELKVKHVIGAYGKRSSIDMKLSRSFVQDKSPFLAIKGHYSGDFAKGLVAIHNFRGGYCGVSKIENDKINICYLADYNSFQKYKNITTYQENVLYQNRHLKKIFEESIPLFEEPMVISQLFFGEKQRVENHILMVGDSAGLIHPLCGNGMAMAIHGAKIVAELLIKLQKNEINSRAGLEHAYNKRWNSEFRTRLRMGHILSTLLRKEKLSALLLHGLTKFPFALNQIIEKTHGKGIIKNVDRYNV
jgi:flavin-dependent dehydrogenase